MKPIDKGENIIWEGVPTIEEIKRDFDFWSNVSYVLFALLFLVFVHYYALSKTMTLLLIIMFVGFVILNIFREISKRKIIKKTKYFIYKDKVVLQLGFGKKKEHVFYLDEIYSIEKRKNHDETGNILFNLKKNELFKNFNFTAGVFETGPPSFMNISDVDEIYKTIIPLLKETKKEIKNNSFSQSYSIIDVLDNDENILDSGLVQSKNIYANSSIRWEGRPGQLHNMNFSKKELFNYIITLLGVLWAPIAILFFTVDITAIFTIALILGLLFLSLSIPFIYYLITKHVRKEIKYILTDTEIIIYGGLNEIKKYHIPLKSIGHMTYSIDSNSNLGTIVLYPKSDVGFNTIKLNAVGRSRQPIIQNIDNTRGVFEIFMRTWKEAKRK